MPARAGAALSRVGAAPSRVGAAPSRAAQRHVAVPVLSPPACACEGPQQPGSPSAAMRGYRLRTRRPGRAPVSRSECRVLTPFTYVAT